MAQQTGRLSLASTSTRAAIRSGHSMLDLQRRIRILCFDLVGFLHLAFAFAPLIRFLLMLCFAPLCFLPILPPWSLFYLSNDAAFIYGLSFLP